MKADFNKTVSILVKAYMNDTLQIGNYCACAVGNLMAEAVGAKFIQSSYGKELNWAHPIYKGGEWYNPYDYELLKSEILINSTGYSNDDIMEIERAFESATRGKSEDESMLNGLMAVLTVLAEIHNVDLGTTENARKLFVKI